MVSTMLWGGGGAKSANSFADGPLCAPHAVRHKKSKMRFLNGLGISGFRVFGLLGSRLLGLEFPAACV